MKRLFTLSFILFLLFSQLHAQDLTCDTSELETVFTDLGNAIVETANQIDESNALSVLLTIDMAVSTARARCTGGIFTSADYPNGIIDPINFTGTLYQATLITDGIGGLSMTIIEGDCGFIPPFMTITALEGGSETDLWQFGGDCIGMFEVNADEWVLQIERLR